MMNWLASPFFGKKKETLKTQELITKEQRELESLCNAISDLQKHPPDSQLSPDSSEQNMKKLNIERYFFP